MYKKTNLNFKSNKDEETEKYLNFVFQSNSTNIINQTNFLDKNFRPKCDLCGNLCDMEWFVRKRNSEKK